MNLDKAPLPRFWYLPRGEKAALVLTGDDHARRRHARPTSTGSRRPTRPAAPSPTGSACARRRTCIPDTPITDAQAAAYEADGFELALHLSTGCADFTPASLENDLTSAARRVRARRGRASSRRSPTARTASSGATGRRRPRLERAHGIRFDTNYYYNGPPRWLTQAGPDDRLRLPAALRRPRRVDDRRLPGDDAGHRRVDETLPTTTQIHTLLDNALGPEGSTGASSTSSCTRDHGDHRRLNDLVARRAAARRAGGHAPPRCSTGSTAATAPRSATSPTATAQLTFSLSARTPKARGLEAMLPARSASRPAVRAHAATASPCRGSAARSRASTTSSSTARPAPTRPPTRTTRRAPGDHAASRPRPTPRATPPSAGRPTSRRPRSSSTAAPPRSAREYADSAEVTDHSVELDRPRSPDTTYRFRVSSADAAGNAATSPAGSAPATFATPPGALVDSRTPSSRAGTQSDTYAGADASTGSTARSSCSRRVGDEFERRALPAARGRSRALDTGRRASRSRAARSSADGAVAHTTGVLRRRRGCSSSRPPSSPSTTRRSGSATTSATSRTRVVHAPATPATHSSVYASSGAWSGDDARHAAPRRRPLRAAPLPDRVERPRPSTFYVDGALVAQHTTVATIDGPLRPVVSDYGLFGAGVRSTGCAMGGYADDRHVHLAHARQRPRREPLADADVAARRCPSGTAIAFETRSGATPQPDATWSAWQPVGAGGAIASPAARYIQYRATLTEHRRVATPTLERVADHLRRRRPTAPPQPGTVASRRALRGRTRPLTATPSGFTRPRRRPAHLPLPVAPQRHRDRRRHDRHAQPRTRRATATAATRSASRSTPPTARGAASDAGRARR